MLLTLHVSKNVRQRKLLGGHICTSLNALLSVPECNCVCFPTRKTDSQSSGTCNMETRIVSTVEVEKGNGNRYVQEERDIQNVQQREADSERACRIREPTAVGAKVHVPLAGSHQPLAYTASDTGRHRSRSRSTEKHPGSCR